MVDTTTWTGLIGLVAIFVYYIGIGVVHCRQDRTDPNVSRFAPPHGMGPAGCRYITTKTWDQKGLAAALISLAVKGFVKISETEPCLFKLTRTGATTQETALSSGERAIVAILFGNGAWSTFVFRPENHALTNAVKKTARRGIKEDFETAYFEQNRHLLSLGTLLTATTLAAMAATTSTGAVLGVLALVLSLLVFAFYPLFLGIWTDWRSGEGAVIAGSLVGATCVLGFAIIFTSALLPKEQPDGLLGWTRSLDPGHAGLVGVIIAVNLFFYHCLKTTKLLGRKVKDDVETFRDFLAAPDKNPPNPGTQTNLTPESLETYLPYAIALDLEQEWGHQFEVASTQTGKSKLESGYQPEWFISPFRSWAGLADFARILGTFFGESVNTSQTLTKRHTRECG